MNGQFVKIENRCQISNIIFQIFFIHNQVIAYINIDKNYSEHYDSQVPAQVELQVVCKTYKIQANKR